YQFSLIIICLLLISNLLVWMQFRSKTRDVVSEQQQIEASYNQLLREYSETRKAWAVSAAANNQRLPEQCEKVIGLKKALVVRISDQYCSTCVDQLLFQVKKYIKQIGPEQLFIVYSGHSPAFVQLKSRSKMVEPVRFIEIPEDLKVSSLDEFHVPYFFIAQKGFITSTFMPYPVNEQHTAIYLDNIAQNMHQKYETNH
ncbi:MAG: hypothetical protein J7L96_06680, partial [Bacteroidales bacterium]|nr:hypothetical protein [Bacteroidales bacterium]